MNAKFARAVRRKARLRLGIMGPSGSGKTMGALKLAFGLCAPEKVFFIDTERGSASLYAHLGAFNVLEMDNDYSPQAYTTAIHAAEGEGAEVIIIDSLSHAWEGKGGALDMVEAATARQKSGNSYTAWREVTPHHRELVDAMLQSPAHIVACLRVKVEYSLEEVNGKKVPKKVGLAPIQRAGLEYEFSALFELDETHHAIASKDRTSIFDSKRFQVDTDAGNKLRAWLESGEVVQPKPVAVVFEAEAPRAPQTNIQTATALLIGAQTLDELKAAWSKITPDIQKSLEVLKNQRKAVIEARGNE